MSNAYRMLAVTNDRELGRCCSFSLRDSARGSSVILVGSTGGCDRSEIGKADDDGTKPTRRQEEEGKTENKERERECTVEGSRAFTMITRRRGCVRVRARARAYCIGNDFAPN